MGGNETDAVGGTLGPKGSVPGLAARDEGAPQGWQEEMTTANKFKTGTQTTHSGLQYPLPAALGA